VGVGRRYFLILLYDLVDIAIQWQSLFKTRQYLFTATVSKSTNFKILVSGFSVFSYFCPFIPQLREFYGNIILVTWLSKFYIFLFIENWHLNVFFSDNSSIVIKICHVRHNTNNLLILFNLEMIPILCQNENNSWNSFRRQRWRVGFQVRVDLTLPRKSIQIH